MIRLLISFAVIIFSLGLGLFLPLPASSGTHLAPLPKSSARSPIARTETPRPAPESAPSAQEPGEKKRLIQLEKAYVILSEPEERSTIIDEISDLETPGTVAVLGRLFSIETDPELKEALLEAVGWTDTPDAAKAVAYAAALPTAQPASVRLAAIDGLSELDANLSMPLLRSLIADSDEEVRSAALETIRSLENQ